MTRGELETRMILLLSYAGFTDVMPSPIPTRLINQAWGEWSWIAECVTPEIVMPSVIGQMLYTLDTTPPNPLEWKEIVDLSFNGLPLFATDENYERYLRPDWLLTAQGTPRRAALVGGGSQFRLLPPPDSIADINLRAIARGSDMTDQNDRPGQVGGTGTAIPGVFHEGIALWAAWIQGKVYASGEETDRIRGYFEESVSYASRCHDYYWDYMRPFPSPIGSKG